MTALLRPLLTLALSAAFLPFAAAEDVIGPLALASPDGRLRLTFRLPDQG